ncbi:T-lymphocyte surface antigen Ly-9-like isoform X2 [Onychostruthus taczanowskii]|uniref:T-lymphocyte surface antigen Ly-9-like isoform X2 n=1 Tax=Onychostruthus taczanowskii TaxID=356909 RepID=UPI001B802475|nr:T-lymphocyte surface antigen Ly-9-like isoform X2 [Onychostruthus taczanowskii]
MAVFWIPLLAVLTLLHPTTSASDTTEVIGVLGGSVTFRTHNTGRKPALWNFGNDPIVTVVVEDPPPPVFYKDEFETRFAVSEKGRALSISQLRMEDAGTYSVITDGKTSTFNLQVFGELAEPTVTCEAQNCSDGSCSFSLRCSAPGAGLGNVSYSWRVRDQPRDGGSVVLRVNESAREEPEPLTCTARNPVSSRNVTVTTPGVLCSGALSSSQVGVRGGIVIVVGILVTAFLLFCLVFLGKSKGWGKFRLSNSNPADTAATDYTTVYAEVGPSQQGVPNGMKAKPGDGGSATTIYSLVKRPEQADDGTAENAAVTGLELV